LSNNASTASNCKQAQIANSLHFNSTLPLIDYSYQGKAKWHHRDISLWCRKRFVRAALHDPENIERDN
jgi:hypothetical protein